VFAVPLLLTAAVPRLGAQASFGGGASLQNVSHGNWDFGFFGSAFDLTVRTSPSTNFVFGVQALGHDENTYVDPVHFRTAEIGMQWVGRRGRLLHLTVGFQAGAYLLSMYDASTTGPILSTTVRLSVHPLRGLGVYVAPVGRALGGERGGSSYGVTFGVLLGVNH
jgi:hypothetical protein